MTQVRLTFVMHQALGWKIYRMRVTTALERRDDVVAQILGAPPEGWRKPFLKRNNMQRSRDRLLRHHDPISALGGGMGASVRAEIARFDPGAIFFAGHWLAGIMAGEKKQPVPFVVATDHTRASMERDLPKGVWSARDMEREARLLRLADHAFPMSDWAGRSIIEDCKVDPARVTVLPPSLDLTRFTPCAYEPRDVLRIAFVGNDFLRKGGDKLCRWVAGPLAGKAELHIVSSDPDAAGERPGVVFHGRMPNEKLLGEFLPGMDVMCLPTSSDMSPLVLIEAAAAGLPAVASRLGAIPEIVLDGETGILVDPGNEAGFLEALLRLRAEPGLRREMGQRAWDLARRKFDADVNYTAMIDRLVDIARRKAAPA